MAIHLSKEREPIFSSETAKTVSEAIVEGIRKGIDFEKVDFSPEHIREKILIKDVNLSGTIVDGILYLNEATFSDVNFKKAVFKAIRITNPCFNVVNFSEATFKDIIFERGNFYKVNFSNAKFDTLAGFVGSNFHQVDFSGAETKSGISVDFEKSVFTDAKFIGANIKADFPHAILTKVVFDNAILTHSTFWRTALYRVSFKNANLRRVHFIEASLAGADFSGADLTDARLLNVAGLADAKNLDKAIFKNTEVDKGEFIILTHMGIDERKLILRKK